MSETTLYHYHPSPTLAGTALGLFLLTLFLHLYQTIRTHPQSLFTVPLLLGTLCEVIGYAARLFNALEHPASDKDYSLAPYIVQAILLLIAPPLIAATLYMHLGNVMQTAHTTNNSRLRIRPALLSWILVIGDLLSFMIQSTGAALLTKPEPQRRQAGSWIVIGGLAVQLLFFVVFVVLLCRIAKFGKNRKDGTRVDVRLWRTHLYTLLSTALLVFVRSVFRLIEYAQGSDGYLLRHEVYLYVFDGLLMFGAVATWNFVHFTGLSVYVKGGVAVTKVFDVREQEDKADEDVRKVERSLPASENAA